MFLHTDVSNHGGSVNVNVYTIKYCYLVLDIVAKWQADKQDLKPAKPLILQYCSKEAVVACSENKYATFYLEIVSCTNINLFEKIVSMIDPNAAKDLKSQYKEISEVNPRAHVAVQAYSSSISFWIKLYELVKNDLNTTGFIFFIVIGLCLCTTVFKCPLF